MQKSKSIENITTSSETSDKASTSSKTQPNLDFSDLMAELKDLNLEGNALFKQSKLEEAKNKFLQGDEKFAQESEKIYKLFTNNDQVDQILSLYKYFLSKIAECYFQQKNYKDAIVYDLKLICLEPKNYEAIYRLFISYSKIEKTQQAVYYGEIFLDFDENIKNKFKNAEDEIEKEKLKLKQIQRNGKKTFNFILINIIFIIVASYVMMLFFNKKKNN